MATVTAPVGVRSSRLPFSPAAIFAGFLLLSLALNFWYLTGGFQADDILFLNMLRSDPLPFSRWRGAWSVPVDRFAGFTSLWWFEPGVQGSFFRPIPSLIFEGGVRLFGHAFPLHLLSIVLHAAVGFTTFLLFARMSGRPLVALLAGIVFVGCEDHSMTVGWIATMTDPLAVLFINIAVLAHLEYRDRCRGGACSARRRRALTVEVAALALSLGCKESAVVAPLAIVLVEIVFGGLRNWRSGARLVLPGLLVLGVYCVAIAAFGIGGMRSLMYVNPAAQPLAYLRHAIVTFPVMISAALTVVPPSLATFTPQFLLPLALAGALLALLFLPAIWPLRGDAALRWALALTLLALLPQVATDASERLLYYPFVGASYVVAAVIAEIGPMRRVLHASTAAPRFTRVWGWYLLAGLVIPGLAMAALMPFMFVPSLERVNRDVASALPAVRAHLQARPAGTVVVLNLAGPYPTFYAGGVLENHLGRPVPTRVLSAMNGVVSIERVDNRSFILRTDRSGWLDNMFARIVRFTPALARGARYSNADFDATLDRVTPDGRDVLDVRFEFRRGLGDPDLLFLSWNGQRLVPVDVASLPEANRVALADTSDVWKSM